MIDKGNCISIGKLKKRFGKNGEFILTLNQSLVFDEFPKNNILFLEVNNAELLPVFIEKYSEHSPDDYRIKFEFPFENINIDYYLGKSVFVDRNLIDEDKLGINNIDIMGWKIIVQNENLEGEIIDIINTKMQEIIVIQIDEKEIMIPLHDDFIEKIDFKKNIIIAKIPEGLLELN